MFNELAAVVGVLMLVCLLDLRNVVCRVVPVVLLLVLALVLLCRLGLALIVPLVSIVPVLLVVPMVWVLLTNPLVIVGLIGLVPDIRWADPTLKSLGVPLVPRLLFKAKETRLREADTLKMLSVWVGCMSISLDAVLVVVVVLLCLLCLLCIASDGLI